MPQERAPFRPDIEGIRGLAILLVVAFHANVGWLAGGFVGVDVFFVLSGFLITGLLAREVADTGDVDLPEFYARRARRLLPAMLVVLVATLAMVAWLYAPIDQPGIAGDGRAVALHYGNVQFATSAVDYYATADNPWLHTWSLAVEEQFYLVWPLLFALVGRSYGNDGMSRRRLLVVVALAGVLSFIACVWVTRAAQHWAFFAMPTRIWEFALGGFAALMVTGAGSAFLNPTLLQVLGLALIGVAAAMYHSVVPYPGVAALVPATGAAALIVGGHYERDSIVSRALALPPLRWLGVISYSWYLWHWPLVGLGAVLDWKLGTGGRLVWSAIALVPAILTHRFIEEPVRRGTLLNWSTQRVTLVSIVASVAAALLAHVAMLVGHQRALSPAQRVFAVARHEGMGHNCWGSLVTDAAGPCVFGDTRARTTVVLMGDSHAEHWLPAVDRIGRERHWKIIAMVKPACPVADMPELVNARLKRTYHECTEWRRTMLRRIVAMKPDAVILSSWDHYIPPSGEGAPWQVTPEMWKAGLQRTYRLLASARINTVVIRGTPRPGFDVPSCLSRQASGAPFQLRACEYDFAESLAPKLVAAQNDAARGIPRLAFVDMNDRFCSGARCAVVQGGRVVFRDDGHLTTAFSRAEAPVLGQRIASALAGMGR